jgi:catechol 2,3-dioxygenase-like lactoylglutathione lyase family enzyme
MITSLPNIANITFNVPDYDEAIEFFCDVLGFDLIEDIDMEPGKRWVRVAPKGGGAALLLAKAVGETQKAAIGNQTGGRVAFFLHTDDFDREYEAIKSAGCGFTGPPRDEPYGRVVVFRDPWGNLWDLIEP